METLSHLPNFVLLFLSVFGLFLAIAWAMVPIILLSISNRLKRIDEGLQDRYGERRRG